MCNLRSDVCQRKIYADWIVSQSLRWGQLRVHYSYLFNTINLKI